MALKNQAIFSVCIFPAFRKAGVGSGIGNWRSTREFFLILSAVSYFARFAISVYNST